MNQIDVMVIIAAAGMGAVVVVIGFLRSSRTSDEGVRKLRLLVNTFLLCFHYASLGVVLALFALGLVRHDTDYWFGALALLLVAFMLFRDMSAPRKSPWEWFSRRPMRTRVRNLKEETRSLLDELTGTDPSDDPEASASADPPRDEPPLGEHSRTFRFEFHWPPRKRPPGAGRRG